MQPADGGVPALLLEPRHGADAGSDTVPVGYVPAKGCGMAGGDGGGHRRTVGTAETVGDGRGWQGTERDSRDSGEGRGKWGQQRRG